MTTSRDPFAPFIGFQSEALEPLRAANGMAADAFERLSRQNYAVLGDLVNFAVEQARLPVQTTDYTQYFTHQMEHARQFGDLLVRRSQEYVEIMTSLQGKAQAAAQTAAQVAVKTTQAAAAKAA
ncbi:MAG: phasin family protein [Gammaproteobacteria bacterium]|nr:phasin family protein [Gammaproteobacteria bacterium]